MRVEVLAEKPDRVVLGPDAEEAVVREVQARGAKRVILVATEGHPEGAARLAELLGEQHASTFLTSVPQVPGHVADAAVALADEVEADWVIAHGGGTPIGVAKAIALERPVGVAAVPTTWAGSERTNIWGLTRNGEKRTGRDDRVRPQVVGYDPTLMRSLPAALGLQSLLNGLAHSIDALFDAQATSHAAAEQSLSVIWRAMEALQAGSEEAHALATRGAWLASEALNGASMALHHKLAHVLGGSHGMPHAPTHAALLPHTLQFNLTAAPRVAALLQAAWGTDDPAAALYDRMRDAGLPVSLRELELPLESLESIVEAVLERRYANPRAYSRQELAAFLLDTWQGRRPSVHARRAAPLGTPGAHGAQRPTLLGPSLDEAHKVVLAVHGRGANADRFAIDLQRRMGAGLASTIAVFALQADRCTWYPRGFRAPVEDNQPHLDQALAVLDAAFTELSADFAPEDIVVAGFSQGACLVLTWLQTTPHRPRRVLAFTGSHTPLPGDWAAANGAKVHLGRAQDDPWISDRQAREAQAALTAHGAEVELREVPGSDHTLHPPDDEALRLALETSE